MALKQSRSKGKTDQEIRAWYDSLKETLLKQGVDLNNPADMLRVRAIYFDEKTAETTTLGDHTNYPSKEVFAMMRRKVNPETGLRSDYVVPEPAFATTQQEQDNIDTLAGASKGAMEAYSASIAEQIDAYKHGARDLGEKSTVTKEDSKIATANKNFQDSLTSYRSQFGEFNNYCMEVFGDYSKWIIANQTPFEPEQDMEEIRELYDMAAQGFLYIKPLNGDPHDLQPLMVDDNGRAAVGACFSESLDTMDYPSAEKLYSSYQSSEAVKDSVKAVLGANPPRMRDYNAEKPPYPPAVPKPGAFSWFKRIISFGIANGDFKKYDRYIAECETYDDRCSALREEILENNEKCLKEFSKALKCPGVTDAPVSNIGEISSNMFAAMTAMKEIPEDDPSKGIYNAGIFVGKEKFMTNFMREAHENPASFNPDGSRNMEESKKYWSTREQTLPPEAIQALDKHAKKLEDFKKAYEVKRNETLVTKNPEMVEAFVDTIGTNSFEMMMNKIGVLFDGDETLGCEMVLNVLSQGRDKTNESMSKALKDYQTMIDMATGKKPMQQGFLREMKAIQNPAHTPLQHIDTMALAYTAIHRGNLTGKPEELKGNDVYIAMLAEKMHSHTSKDKTMQQSIESLGMKPLSSPEAMEKLCEVGKACGQMSKSADVAEVKAKLDLKVQQPEPQPVAEGIGIGFPG